MPRLSDEGTHNKIYNVILPVESVGRCKNATNCGNTNTTLGNGYCMNCYDRGLDTGIKPSDLKTVMGQSKIEVGERILETIKLRKQGMTYKAIGEKLGVSKNTVFSYTKKRGDK